MASRTLRGDILAEAGLLPAAAVAKIRAGKGKLDSARDCVELAALFGKNAGTRGASGACVRGASSSEPPPGGACGETATSFSRP